MQRKLNIYELYFPKYEEILFALCKKILEQKQKAIVFSADQKLIETADTCLWTMGRSVFIPHDKIENANPNKQPILLINSLEALENQKFITDNLIILGTISQVNIKPFTNTIVITERQNSENIAQIQQDFIKNKDIALAYKISYYKQNEAGKWQG